MRKKNNKGFFASVLVYPLLLLFLVLVSQVLTIANIRKSILDQMKVDIGDNTYEEEVCSYFIYFNKMKKVLATGVGDKRNLTLRIKTYESAALLPIKDNQKGDIAIITNTPIPSYYVSGYMPSGMGHGDIWFIHDEEAMYSYSYGDTKMELCYAMQKEHGNLEMKRFYVFDGKKWK